MTSFGIIVTWRDRQVTTTEVGRMLDPIRHAFQDGVASRAVPSAAAAVALQAVVQRESVDTSLLVDEARQWIAVGDVRLYDRSTLVAALGAESRSESDLSLLVHAYARFGASVLSAVPGDFAFVLWDWRQRKAFAIRDHFGLRPLYYLVMDDGIALASDVRQLLSLTADRRIDAGMAVDYLLTRFVHPGRTFFSGIRSVRPAHHLVASDSARIEQRYWMPSVGDYRGTYADAVHEWRHRFTTSVRDRFRSDHSMAAYLSGGMDSSSIVGAAHELLTAESTGAAKVYTLSARFSGFPCDEKRFIEDVARHCPSFESLSWDGSAVNEDDLLSPVIAMPGLREGIGRGRRSEAPLVRARDCRVVMSGAGGDTLSWSKAALADLLLNGNITTLARELRDLGSLRENIRQTLFIAAGARWPRWLSPRQRVAPGWLGPDARSVFSEDSATAAPLPAGSSRLHERVWRDLAGARGSYVIDMEVVAGRDAGSEVRMPYLDLRLVNFSLSIPWQLRLPHGDSRRMQRDSIGPFLPPSVRWRRDKARFGCMVAHQLRCNLSRIERLFADRTWASFRYVDQVGVRQGLATLKEEDPGIARPSRWYYLWNAAVFEVWNRRVIDYDATPT